MPSGGVEYRDARCFKSRTLNIISPYKPYEKERERWEREREMGDRETGAYRHKVGGWMGG